MTTALIAALEKRRQEAVAVKTTYHLLDVGSQCWVVTHPDDDERSYLVDGISRTCNCPAFTCRAKDMRIDCKHIIALLPEWEAQQGTRIAPQLIAPLFPDMWASVVNRNRGGGIFVHGPYHDELVSHFRWLGGEWNGRDKAWRFKSHPRIAASLAAICPEITGDRDFNRMLETFAECVKRSTRPITVGLDLIEQNKADTEAAKPKRVVPHIKAKPHSQELVDVFAD